MKLVYATDDLIIAGRPYSGFPILLWDSMESCVPVNQFFRYYLLRGAIGSKQSWPSTGRALYDYFSFLEVHGLEWNVFPEGEDKSLLASYRDYAFEEAQLARDTVRQRLLYVSEFYQYAQRQGWIDRLPFGYEDRHVRRENTELLAHVDASGNTVKARDVMPRKHKKLVKFLAKDQVIALLAAADNVHHKMMLRLGLQLGLRREEIATFPLANVFDPDRAGRQERNIRITLDPYDGHGIKTKGSKERDVFIGRRFLKELHHYAVHHRGERASLSTRKHEALFLNQVGEPFAADGRTISQIVRDVGRKAGLIVNTHMLRHTYATHTLVALQRDRSKTALEPLVFLQKQLGHSSISTTMVYLHLINERADDAVLAYDDELNDWIGVN